MSERRTDTGSTDSGSTDTGSTGRPDRHSQHEQDNEEFQAGTGYQPSTNQAQDEPVPASHHDDGRQEADRRRGEPVRDDSAPRTQEAAARPGGRSSEQPGKGERTGN